MSAPTTTASSTSPVLNSNVNSIIAKVQSSIPQQIIVTTVGLGQLTNNFFTGGLSNECAMYGEMEVCIFCFCLLQVANVVYVCLNHVEYFKELFSHGVSKSNILIHLSHFMTLGTTIASGFMWISAANINYLVCMMVVNDSSRTLSDPVYQNLTVWVAVLLFTSSVLTGITQTFHEHVCPAVSEETSGDVTSSGSVAAAGSGSSTTVNPVTGNALVGSSTTTSSSSSGIDRTAAPVSSSTLASVISSAETPTVDSNTGITSVTNPINIV